MRWDWRNNFGRLGLLVSLVLVVQACSAPAPSRVTLRLSGNGGGNVNVNGVDRALPWSTQFDMGFTATILAVPETGFAFNGWSGDVSGQANPLAVTLRSSLDIQVAFVEEPRLLIEPATRAYGEVQVGSSRDRSFVVTNIGGSVLVGRASTSAPFSIVGDDIYNLPAGESQLIVVRFSPTDEGSAADFVDFTGGGGWIANVTGTGVATTPETVDVAVEVTGAGSVTSDPVGISCPGSCGASFALGSDLLLTAVPNVGGEVPTWTGCDNPASNDVHSALCVLTVSSSRTISADFTPALEVMVSLVPNSVTVFTGQRQPFTATVTGTADTRVTWSASGGTIAGSGTTVTYTAPQEAGSYTITATSRADGSARATATVTVEANLVTAIVAGDAFSLALKADGTVWAWGDNSSGQLGLGNQDDTNTPTQVPALFDVVSITAGSNHALALRADGLVWAWGSNHHSQLGQYLPSVVSTPTLITYSAGTVGIAAGDNHTLLLRDTGEVDSFGANWYAQVGNGTYGEHGESGYASPVRGLPPIREIQAGRDHSIARARNGSIYAWGFNLLAQIGTTESDLCHTSAWLPCLMSPVLVSGATGAIAAGGKHNVTLDSVGTLQVWGDNGYGQLGTADAGECWVSGDSAPNPCSHFVLTLSGLPPVSMVAGGLNHTVVVSTDGRLYAWGSNMDRQLGVASSDGCQPGATPPLPCSKTPLQVSSLSGVVLAAAGSRHTLAVLADGSVWGWGANASGQIGDGSFSARSTPVLVQMP